MSLLALDAYDMSPERGFLCRYNADEVILPGDWAQAAAVARRLPQLLPTGRVRHLMMRGLPMFKDGDVDQLTEEMALAGWWKALGP